MKDREELDSFFMAVHLSVERGNRNRRTVLAGKCAWERREEEFPHFTRRERESVRKKTQAHMAEESPYSVIWKAKNT